MIDTGKATTKALKQIRDKTGWEYTNIASRLDIPYQTIWKISKGKIANPKQTHMLKIETLHTERCGQ